MQRLSAVVGLAMAVAVAMVWLAAGPPHLGLGLYYDAAAGGAVVGAPSGPGARIPAGLPVATLSGAGRMVALEALDFTAEPDGLALFAQYDDLLRRQGDLIAIQRAPLVTLGAADGATYTLAPQASRPIADLPAGFWVQIAVAVFSFLIAGGIWAFRPNMAATRWLLLSGLATLTFSSCAAVYSTRELALDPILFRGLGDINFLGGTVFAATLVALLLHYPRRIAPWWIGVGLLAFYLAWWVAQQLGAFESMVVARRIHVLAALLVTFVLAGVQWRGTRADPVGRAALQWFLLSWLVCATSFILLILAPQLVGVDTAPYQGYAFLLFLLLYAGLALGVTRFRLFDLGEWWIRSVIWGITLAALVALDLVFVLVLRLSGEVSLSLSLLLCGLLWLPLRAVLWGRFFGRPDASSQAVFGPLVNIGLADGAERQRQSWRDLLGQVFAPLNMTPLAAPAAPAAPVLADDGLALIVPAVDALPAMRLEYARGGRRLFTRSDQAAAVDLVSMLRHVFESRRAYERGVTQERRRIAADIHDNVGARLLGALHIGGEVPKNERIRETLADLGRIINDVAAQPGTLDETLAELRLETLERAEAEGVTLDWPLDGSRQPAPLSAAAAHALRSIVREAVSNAIRHAGARVIAVTLACDDGVVRLSVEDDGRGFDPAKVTRGSGLETIRARAEARGGAAIWSAGAGGRGTRIAVRLPVQDGPPARAAAGAMR